MSKKSPPADTAPCPVAAPHARPVEDILASLHGSPKGLDQAEAAARLQRYGCNALPAAEPPGIAQVFLRQFASPLIYVLVAAALVSLAIREWSDAGFICAVLLLNAIIGTVQEYSAQRAATALQQLVRMRCRVLRDGDAYECEAEELVPGDIVLLESGERVPADLRLLTCHDLEVDESLLTGESRPISIAPLPPRMKISIAISISAPRPCCGNWPGPIR